MGLLMLGGTDNQSVEKSKAVTLFLLLSNWLSVIDALRR